MEEDFLLARKSSIGWYCGAGVFGLIVYISLSLSALRTADLFLIIIIIII